MKQDQDRQAQIIKVVIWAYAALELILFCSGNLLVGLAGLFCVLLIVVFCGLLDDKLKPLEMLSNLALDADDDFFQVLEVEIKKLRSKASVAGEGDFADALTAKYGQLRTSDRTPEDIAAEIEKEIRAAYPHLRKALLRNLIPATLRRIYHRVTK